MRSSSVPPDAGYRAPKESVGIRAGAGLRGGFDRQVRDRVTSDISAFLVALDALWHADNPQNRELLLDATDRLLRAGARTRIELERLRQLGPKTDS